MCQVNRLLSLTGKLRCLVGEKGWCCGCEEEVFVFASCHARKVAGFLLTRLRLLLVPRLSSMPCCEHGENGLRRLSLP